MAENDPAPGAEPTLAQLQADLAAARARIKEVNDEAKGHRLNSDRFRGEADEAKRKATEAEAAAAAKIAEAEKAKSDAVTAAQQRVVKADLRLAAKDAGANDANDVLALIPSDQWKLNADGEIENAAELIAGMKTAKPYLFGAASSSSTAPPPAQQPPAAKPATQMTDAEWQTARAALLKAQPRS